jgi:hypothetical protein
MARKALSPKQHKALALLVAGQTQESVSLALHVKHNTIREWMRDETFRDELRLALERMRQTFEARVMQLANNASVVVGQMIEGSDPDRQLEGAKLAFNAAVRLSNRYKELQVEGYVAPAQPLVVFPAGTKFPWQGAAVLPPGSEMPQLPAAIDAEVYDVAQEDEEPNE